MTISPPSGLLGVQRPRLLNRPEAAVSSGAVEAIELAASAGLILDEWQCFALDVALSERADGKWAAFEVGMIVPRQNGKGSILEARELAGLFLFGERLILHSAHEFKTAAEAFLRVKALVDNTDDLRRKVKQIRTSHGDEGIELLDGARLRFVARSRGSGRGFSGDCVILDEAFNLGAEAMGALLPTLSAKPNPQIWYTSLAPMAGSVQLHAVRRRALAGGSPRLAFMEWSIDPEADRVDDPGSWAKANPSFGIRIGEEVVRAEIDAMPAPEFARERLVCRTRSRASTRRCSRWRTGTGWPTRPPSSAARWRSPSPCLPERSPLLLRWSASGLTACPTSSWSTIDRVSTGFLLGGLSSTARSGRSSGCVTRRGRRWSWLASSAT